MKKGLTLEKFLERVKYVKKEAPTFFQTNHKNLKYLIFKWMVEIYYIYFSLIGFEEMNYHLTLDA